MKTIAVYGSSRITAADPEYHESREVGRLLAQAGYAVMTGGYGGVMEATSRGAAEAGGHVIGVTTSAIEAIRPQAPNQWVAEVVHHPQFSRRVLHLVANADGFVAMPGGIGTLHEIVTVWELMRVGEINAGPVVCYGAYWRDLLTPILNTRYVHPEYRDLVRFADSPADVIARLHSPTLEQA